MRGIETNVFIVYAVFKDPTRVESDIATDEALTVITIPT